MTAPPQPKEFLCIAHRGAAGYAPENTLESFSKAIELGAGWIEFDVRVVESTPVVFHDATLKRLTGIEGSIEEQSLDFVRSLQVHKRCQIPLLRETLALLRGKACAQIELKGRGSGVATAAVVGAELLNGWRAEELLVSSFLEEELLEFHRLIPEIPTGVLSRQLTPDTIALAQQIGAYSIHLKFRNLRADDVTVVHENGFKVFAYTVNDSNDLLAMYSLGVDGVFTDYPDRVLSKSFL